MTEKRDLKDDRKFSAEEVNEGLLDFIRRSPNSFFAAENIAVELRAAGFEELSESERWELRPGGRYLVRRNGSSLIAFRMPEAADADCGTGGVPAFHIYAAHPDSPAFKIKPNAEIRVEDKYLKLNVERYGGMLMSTWLDRPLSAAGRLVIRDGAGVSTVLVNLDRDLFVIPNLAIHMDRGANESKSWNPQNDMLPLFAGLPAGGGEDEDSAEAGKDRFLRLVASEAGVEPENILDADLFLYNREPGTVFGAEREFIASPRLDDLQCLYAGLRGFLEASADASAGTDTEAGADAPGGDIPVFCVLDNEEIGSGTKQGAASDLLRNTLFRICGSEAFSAGAGEAGAPGISEAYYRALAKSFMISADNAHGVHPNDASKADPTNRPVMNGGIVIKYTATMRYATDALSGAVFRRICELAGVPCQTFANRSDIPGGSTLGTIADTQVSVSTVDIGLPQLAMHSTYETAGARDTAYLAAAARTFFSTRIRFGADGTVSIGK